MPYLVGSGSPSWPSACANDLSGRAEILHAGCGLLGLRVLVWNVYTVMYSQVQYIVCQELTIGRPTKGRIRIAKRQQAFA